MTPPRRPARRRNACLAVLELLRRGRPDLSLNQAIAFLYVCENEGINIREFSELARLTQSTASRTIQHLIASSAEGEGMGLMCLKGQDCDKRGRTIWLSAEGMELRHTVNAIITAADPILPSDGEALRDGPRL